jgi:hypothetical protein
MNVSRWLNVGCGQHYAPGWHNVDVVCRPELGITPDQVVPARVRLDEVFPAGGFDRVFLGHVLEHVPWGWVPEFLAGVTRVLAPGGEVLVVGPDCFRVIERWRDGLEPWWLVVQCLEGDSSKPGLGDESVWDGARHHWNAHEQRVVDALETAGFVGVTGVPLGSELLNGWPVVLRVEWQCAVYGRVAG